ncbi:MAG TPA: wax ester/triacylglycerol synthase domain-containing protein [Acidimicrobiales bacterium]
MSHASNGRHLTEAEALMWSLDGEPALRSSFLSITFLDHPPSPERYRRRMTEAVDAVEALRLRVVPAPLGLTPPRWEPDPDFDVDRHVRFASLPPPGDRRHLLDLAALLSEEPFDRAHPLWQFTLVDGLEDGGCALLAKMHHVVSDGVGAVRISVSFLDLAPDGNPENVAPAPPAPTPTAARSRLEPVTTAIATNASEAWKVAGAIATMVRSPGAGLRTVRSLGRQAGFADPARSPLWRERSHRHRFETLNLDLEQLHAAARALGGTVNDAFVTVMAAAAGEYHRALSAPVDDLRISMPISVRHDRDVGGNAWVPARVLVPTGTMTPAARFQETSARLAAVKREPSLGLADAFAGVFRHLPQPLLVPLARQQVGTVDFACSNVRGAPFDLWIAGSHVESNHPMGPTAGVAFNATVLSYKQSLDLGLNIDTGAISEPGLLSQCVVDAAAALVAAA